MKEESLALRRKEVKFEDEEEQVEVEAREEVKEEKEEEEEREERGQKDEGEYVCIMRGDVREGWRERKE